MKALPAIALITLLTSSSVTLADPPMSSAVALSDPIPAELEAMRIHNDAEQGFEYLESIVLVRVIDSTFLAKLTRDTPDAASGAHATARVVRAWKGPFAAGTVVHLVAPMACAGPPGSCLPYPVQKGDELLVFAGATDPLVAAKSWTRRAADSIATMAVLDVLAEPKDLRGTLIPHKN
jgi:hypothetical protein